MVFITILLDLTYQTNQVEIVEWSVAFTFYYQLISISVCS